MNDETVQLQQQLRRAEQQLIELQAQLAFQEDVIQTLDNVVVAQQRRLDQLEQNQHRLEKQLAEGLVWANEQAPVELPPHY